MCYQNYSGLVIEGEATEEELQKAWIPIYIEFIELSDDPDVSQMIKLVRAIYKLKNRLAKVKFMVSSLANLIFYERKHETEVMEELIFKDLRKLNFKYRFDVKNPQQYSKDLNHILTRIIEWEIQQEQFEIELKAYEDKMAGEPPSEIYFTTNLIRLANYTKYRIDPEQVSVREYCLLRKDYGEYYKQLKAEKNAKHR
jgi:hypothetical protein